MEITGIERIKLGDRVIAQSDKTHTILHDVNSITTVKITTESYQIIKDLCDRRISLYKSGTDFHLYVVASCRASFALHIIAFKADK